MSTATAMLTAVIASPKPTTIPRTKLEQQLRRNLVDLVIESLDLSRELVIDVCQREHELVLHDIDILPGGEIVRLSRNLRREDVRLLFAEARRAQLLGDAEGV